MRQAFRPNCPHYIDSEQLLLVSGSRLMYNAYMLINRQVRPSEDKATALPALRYDKMSASNKDEILDLGL